MKRMNLKRNLILGGLVLVMVCSMGVAVYADSVYPYPNGYKMNYDIYKVTVAGSGGVGGYTNTENDAIAFVGLFSYKNGTVKNSGTKQQDFYVSLAIPASGGNYFVSHHALKYSNNVPVGASKHLELK